MFEMMSAEKMKSEIKNFADGSELESNNHKIVQIKPSLMDRGLSVLGQVMINTGLKLKYRQHIRLSTEEARSPNFLIML
jgi:hypothetical protein